MNLIIARIIAILFGLWALWLLLTLPSATVETEGIEAVWVPEGAAVPIVAAPFEQRVF
jgi:hypothetical protein